MVEKFGRMQTYEVDYKGLYDTLAPFPVQLMFSTPYSNAMNVGPGESPPGVV